VIAGLKAEALPNVTVVEKAVSDMVGEAVLHVDIRPDLGAAASSLMELSGMEAQTQAVTVPTTTVDAFSEALGAYPDLVKIDVERFEPNVIGGAHRVIERRRPIIIFELWESHWGRYQPMTDYLRRFYHMVRLSDGADAQKYYSANTGEGVDDILCIPLSPHYARS